MNKALIAALYQVLCAVYNNWLKPSPTDEMHEFDRIAGVDRELMLEKAASAKLVTLTDKMWSQLENTDSWETTDLKLARELAAKYHRTKAFEEILQGFEANKPMLAPVILTFPTRPPYLVGGNTRLMVARALGIRPKVLAVELAKGKPHRIA